MAEHYVWEIRNPDGGSLGLEFARGKTAPVQVLLSHALPERIDVEVRDDRGALIARGEGLSGGQPLPMARLRIHDGTVERKNLWPGRDDVGRPVILCGGEVGTLERWWNAEDGTEWRWSIELHNRTG